MDPTGKSNGARAGHIVEHDCKRLLSRPGDSLSHLGFMDGTELVLREDHRLWNLLT